MPEFKFDNALVLSARPLGERTYKVSLLTDALGRHAGVVRGKKMPATAGLFSGRWQARLGEQTGHFYGEETAMPAAPFLEDAARLKCLLCLCGLLDAVLPERHPHPELYGAVMDWIAGLGTADFLMRYVRLELLILSAVGFGLDMSCCAGGGDACDLAYISPKTGRSVSRDKGRRYDDRLLALPAFLWRDAPATPRDIRDGLKLTAYFFIHKGGYKLPKIREQLLDKAALSL
ncbi:MAG: DNA repair protein RecO [Alphaproteobacteria bacterium]|nr:DNA repair protein RecO [Alphaproteobacteria bacterium]